MTSKPLERDIENRCVKHAIAYGWEHAKLDKARRNWPDQVFFGPFEAVFIVEFKRPGEAPRPGQTAVHRKLRKLDHVVYVIDNFDDFAALLDRMTAHATL